MSAISDTLQKVRFGQGPSYLSMVEGLNVTILCQNPKCSLSSVGLHWSPVGHSKLVNLLGMHPCKSCATLFQVVGVGFDRCQMRFEYSKGRGPKFAELCTSNIKDPAFVGFDYLSNCQEFANAHTYQQLAVITDTVLSEAEQKNQHAKDEAENADEVEKAEVVYKKTIEIKEEALQNKSEAVQVCESDDTKLAIKDAEDAMQSWLENSDREFGEDAKRKCDKADKILSEKEKKLAALLKRNRDLEAKVSIKATETKVAMEYTKKRKEVAQKTWKSFCARFLKNVSAALRDGFGNVISELEVKMEVRSSCRELDGKNTEILQQMSNLLEKQAVVDAKLAAVLVVVQESIRIIMDGQQTLEARRQQLDNLKEFHKEIMETQ